MEVFAGRSIGLARIGSIVARAVDTAISSLDTRDSCTETEPVPLAPTVPPAPSVSLGGLTIGLAALVRTVHLVRPIHDPTKSKDGTDLDSRRRRNQCHPGRPDHQ